MYCKNCGEKIGDGDVFCPKCGQRQNGNNRHDGNKSVLLGVIIALSVVIVALVAFFIVFFGGKSENNQTLDSAGTAGREMNQITESPVASSEEAEENSDKMAEAESAKPTATPFAAHEATEEMKKELKPIMNQTIYFFGLLTEVEKIKWDDNMRTIMTYYNLEYRDSKIKYNETEKKARPQVEKEMKHLFGSGAKYVLKYSKDYPGYLYSVQGSSVVYNGGDWGDGQPIGKTLFVAETEQDVYRVVRYVGIKDVMTGEKSYSKKVTCMVKKDDNSKYGYVITDVSMYKKGDMKVP